MKRHKMQAALSSQRCCSPALLAFKPTLHPAPTVSW